MKIHSLCLGAVLVLVSNFAYPKVYRYVDDQGLIVYSDRAPVKVQKQEDLEFILPSAPSEAAIKSAEEREARLKSEAEKMANERKERARAAQSKAKEAVQKTEEKASENKSKQQSTIATPATNNQ